MSRFRAASTVMVTAAVVTAGAASAASLLADGSSGGSIVTHVSRWTVDEPSRSPSERDCTQTYGGTNGTLNASVDVGDPEALVAIDCEDPDSSVSS